jgi:hypothetical protein
VAGQQDVRRIALASRRRARQRPDVVAMRAVDQQDKDALLASNEENFFTEPHYNGFPAVLVRLTVDR